jgi:SAM-dependent methyltransferase
VTYLHPLAYLLGIEGVTLLRSFAGDFDREFVEARLAEIRRLVNDETLIAAGIPIGTVGTVDGYEVWAKTYDEPGNGAFPLEEPYVRRIIDSLPTGCVVDAACGTGRHTEYLAAQGHHVIGVDSSPDMLTHARNRVPAADFRLGRLDQLPLADNEADAIICTLALTHVADLHPVMAEFARILRPGGDLIISDMHERIVLHGSVPKMEMPDGSRARITTHRHLTGDYLRAALPVGLQVRSCEEPRPGKDSVMPAATAMTPDFQPGDWHDWPWNLSELIPQAAWAAHADIPHMVIWHFQLTA